MIGLCWNVRGLGNPRSFAALRRLLKKHSPDLVFLTETKIGGKWANNIREKLGFAGGLSVDCRGKSGGLLLLWTDRLDITVLSYSSGHIDVRINMEDGFRWRFSGFYGNPAANQRADSWNLLRRLRAVDTLPWVCGGDFNDILSLTEKKGGSDKSIVSMRGFREAVDDCELIDLGFSGPSFTWNNKRNGDSNIQERLDRIMADEKWLKEFNQVSVDHLSFFSSDHRPLLLRTGSRDCSNNFIGRGFKFEPFWLKEDDISNIIETAWLEKKTSANVFDLKSKLSWCAAKLMGWSKERFGSLRKSINDKQKMVDSLYLRSHVPGVMEEIREMEKELEGLLDREEIYWRQRARADWLSAGDRNSSFFHRRASNRRKKNQITKLMDGDGKIKEAEIDLSRIICTYFSSLFQSTDPLSSDIDRATAFIEGKLDPEMQSRIGAEFQADEVKRAIFDMNPTKAPGPDGFQALFFQKFWSVIGPEVTNICLKVLNGKASISEFNGTNIALIPKVKNPTTITDFRPISLCSVIYKAVTKSLANRLKDILPFIISPNQSAFIPGRLIFDNVLVAFETLHSISRKKDGRKGLMALKLDMSKAYDRLEWGFLQAVLKRMCFPHSWISVVMDCISSSKLSFLLNGKSVGCVIPTRGLRQGCPLSPYLFILCAEALSSLIKNSEANGRSMGIRCIRGSPLVSHLFFADDSLLFCKASTDSCNTIRNFLRTYEKASGQQVNLQKSKVTFSPNVPQAARKDIQGFFQIPDSNTQDKYLGLPTLVGRNKRRIFNEIKERVWKKIRGWKGSLFSFGGKEVLIKAVAQAIPTYLMSLFQLPIGLCKELGGLISKFWWGSRDGQRKISWVKWEELCLPKSLGGLGFKDLLSFNQSLLAKQAWRILKFPESMASRVLKAKYFKDKNFLEASPKPGCSHIWKSILWGRDILRKGLRWKVGNGASIKVFTDPWIPIPSSFKPVSPTYDQYLKVADLIDQEHHCWNVNKLKSFFLPIDIEAILSIPISVRNREDVLTWHYDKKGVLSVKSAYQVAVNNNLQPSCSSFSNVSKWWKFLWSLNIPPKIRIFIWRACRNALPSMINLLKRNVVNCALCRFCESRMESIEHALLWCGSARKIWSCTNFDSSLKMFKELPMIEVLSGMSLNNAKSDMELLCVILWGIWENRNASYNNGKVRRPFDLVTWASNMLVEFQHSSMVLSPKTPLVHSPKVSQWLPPPSGTLKLNTDASVHSEAMFIGVGAVIRDHCGTIVAADSKPLMGAFTAEMGEFLALREGLLLAKNHNLSVQFVEVDASAVASALNSSSINLGDACNVILDIKALFVEVGVVSCLAIPRLGNSMAHNLASRAYSSVKESYWLNYSPVVS